MATLTAEQIDQKKQLLAEKLKEMKAIYDELVEAGAIELTDEELDGVAGGGVVGDWFKQLGKDIKKYLDDFGSSWLQMDLQTRKTD